MLVRRFTRLKLGAILATSFVVGMSPGPGHAYTDEEQQACTGDAFRLCSSDIPDVDRVTACMIRNKSQLSPGCPRVLRTGARAGRGGRRGSAGRHQADGPAKVPRQAAQDPKVRQAVGDVISHSCCLESDLFCSR